MKNKTALLLFLSAFLFFSVIFHFFFIGARMSGESMLPTLKPYDYIFFVKTDNIQVGDIIVYKYPEHGRIIHRVIEIEDERYIMKGDNNQGTDRTYVTNGNILGKMILRIPFGEIFR